MTALHLLLHELATNGPITYAALYAKYGPRGYTRVALVQAVWKARKRGLVKPARSGTYGRPIQLVEGAVCPCCGRVLNNLAAHP